MRTHAHAHRYTKYRSRVTMPHVVPRGGSSGADDGDDDDRGPPQSIENMLQCVVLPILPCVPRGALPRTIQSSRCGLR